MRQLFVYILASKNRRLYTGVAYNLQQRVYQHINEACEFTARYRIDRLVYYEQLGPPIVAIEREKSIKGLLRSKKIALIESMNRAWDDLAEHWVERPPRKTDPSLRSG